MKYTFIFIFLFVSSCLFGQFSSEYQIDTLIDSSWDAANLSISKDGKFLLFDSNTSGTSQIYSYSFENKNITRLTDIECGATQGCFHPNGKSIAFVKTDNQKLYKLNFSDSSVSVLFDRDIKTQFPQYNNSGNLIVFSGLRPNQNVVQIFTYDFVYDNLNQLTELDKHCIYPRWSPLSELITFETYNSEFQFIEATIINWYGKFYGNISDGAAEIRHANWSNSDYKTIFIEKNNKFEELITSKKDKSSKETILSTEYFLETPVWIPNTRKIVFVCRNYSNKRCTLLVDLDKFNF